MQLTSELTVNKAMNWRRKKGEENKEEKFRKANGTIDIENESIESVSYI